MGLHGEMRYLGVDNSVQKRSDPRLILPECKSILILATRYPKSEHPMSLKRALPTVTAGLGDNSFKQWHGLIHGKIAAYAWGDDYHDILVRRLRYLSDFIQEKNSNSIPHRYYTDTGPILERDLAQRAGLGWIGKNTCLINPQFGSYFFLAEILLGIDLEVDQPFLYDRCGSCTRCLQACPTQCILPDRTLDACRCISYLTIESKGAIPTHLRAMMGDWVFGCDICQQVCPWNRFADNNVNPEFKPRSDLPEPSLNREMTLTQEDFSQKFKNSPVKRARRSGYLRNVAIALGNSKDPVAVPVLRTALLTDPEPQVRAHAAWALSELGFPESIMALTEARSIEQDRYVISEIDSASARVY